MNRNALLMVVGCFLVATFAVQFRQISRLRAEVSALRANLSASGQSDPAPVGTAPALEKSLTGTEELHARLAQLERSVANLARAPRPEARGVEYGGAISDEELARLQERLLDASAPEGDRLRALRALRRNNRMNDDTLIQTLGLLQTSTNANFRRELLQNLEGLTNAPLKGPLMAMLDTPGNEPGLRGQVVNMLRRFADDPAVESKLWDLALHDPNTRTRDQAAEALAHAPVTPERIEQLLNKTTNPSSSLEERLVSFRALRLAKSETPEVISELANFAQNSTDPIARAKLFKSFNGLTDPSLMLPLVNGLQDSDPVVRQNAANALSEFPDPRVQQWLTHLIQNDADPAVKREAHAALERTMRLSGRAQ